MFKTKKGKKGFMNFDSKKAKEIYINTLRKMSPEQKLKKACELSDFTKMLFRNGLKKRYPDLNDEDLRRKLIERLTKCGNSNY